MSQSSNKIASLTWQIKYVFLGTLAFRLINAFANVTFFQPDEFFQCLEPAHRFVFGYGYLTWEWKQGLRSSIHPLIYALGYKLVYYLERYGIVEDSHLLVQYVPKIIGALIASVGETHLYIFVKRYNNNLMLGKIALLLSLANPFNWYVITRSFSNCLELSLTTIALAHWPWRSKDYRRLYVSCSFAFVACIIRPTNAVIWIVLGIYFVSILDTASIAKLAGGLVAEFLGIIAVETGLNRIFYGFWTFPLYNFVEFNVIRNLSVFYGSSPWHFHIFQSVPLLLMTYLPFLLYSVVVYKAYLNILGVAAIATLVMFSAIGHKEFRFIYPLMSIFLLFTSYSVRLYYLKKGKTLLVAVLLVNILVAAFFSRVNEKGEIDVIDYLKSQGKDFGFLTPCHSTPWQSQLHDPSFQTSWFITCEPPLHLTDTQKDTILAYRDESDRMLDDPERFVAEVFPEKYLWPSQLVLYEAFDEMQTILQRKGYQECHRLFNSYFHWDERRRGDILVYCRPADLELLDEGSA